MEKGRQGGRERGRDGGREGGREGGRREVGREGEMEVGREVGRERWREEACIYWNAHTSHLMRRWCVGLVLGHPQDHWSRWLPGACEGTYGGSHYGDGRHQCHPGEWVDMPNGKH